MHAWVASIQRIDDTQRLADAIAASIEVPLMLALCGTLGSGKTELVRSLSIALGVPAEHVTSPTYVLVQRYHGRVEIMHLDFYRLENIGQVWDLGVDEWLESPVLTVVEWAEKFVGVWPENWIRIDLTLTDDGQRTAALSASGGRARRVLDRVQSVWQNRETQ